uniref:Uncharacterized protein n=1 Tax=Timema douglasi TaxID=61478 RepID=A0A7R8VSU1_TIMDO|nr:unnamed protein product [Timema douglasi]
MSDYAPLTDLELAPPEPDALLVLKNQDKPLHDLVKMDQRKDVEIQIQVKHWKAQNTQTRPPTKSNDARLWTYHYKESQCERTRNKCLRIIVDSSWYVRNVILHRDQEIPTTRNHFRKMAQYFYGRLFGGTIPLFQRLWNYVIDPGRCHRRPKALLGEARTIKQWFGRLSHSPP